MHSSQCEIFSQALGERAVSGEYGDTREQSTRLDHRQKTYLFCVIEKNGELWEMTLFSDLEEPFEVDLFNGDDFYEVTGHTDEVLLRKTERGEDREPVPYWAAFNTGLEFTGPNGKVAAQSFVGKPKIWLSNTIEAEEKHLLLAANYSLAMFDWLDDDWRVRHNSLQ